MRIHPASHRMAWMPAVYRILICYLFVILNHIGSAVYEIAKNHSAAHDVTIYLSAEGLTFSCGVYSLFHNRYLLMMSSMVYSTMLPLLFFVM